MTNGDCGFDGGGATDSPIDNPQSSIVNQPMRIAVIDVGTNTVRLLVADRAGGSAYRPLLTDQEITRLGEGLLPDKILQPAPIRRTLHALRRFRETAETQGAAIILAVGTSALREAVNRAAFLARARRDAGIEIAVISGRRRGGSPSWGSAPDCRHPPIVWSCWISAVAALSSFLPMGDGSSHLPAPAWGW